MDDQANTIIVTGGAGFIGSAVIRYLLNNTPHRVINVDKLTYAGNLESLASIEASPSYCFEKVDICDRGKIDELFERHQPDWIMHLAAETHVDRSIDGPAAFIKSNIVGTYTLLEAALTYWRSLSSERQSAFRFHHISTDEVYGDLGEAGLFTEQTPYAPSSPYSASKASSDHLVRSWHRTYGLPVVITNCSNNYGQFQFPEKLIPLMILNAINGKNLPVYGAGTQIRDWLHVDDHARALYRVIQGGILGQTYNIGGHNEVRNIDVVHSICSILDELRPDKPSSIQNYSDLISYVDDRPGHDVRYAIDATKIEKDLGWVPDETFESGLRKTVEWYLSNLDWCDSAVKGSYQGERLGTNSTLGS